MSGETEGTIITRNQGESTYGNNVNCMWLIDAGVGKQIKLSIISTDLEWAPTYTTCSGYDNLQIVEGITVKPVLSCHSKMDKTKVLKTNGSLMKVESIAECSLGAFCNTFELH